MSVDAVTPHWASRRSRQWFNRQPPASLLECSRAEGAVEVALGGAFDVRGALPISANSIEVTVGILQASSTLLAIAACAYFAYT